MRIITCIHNINKILQQNHKSELELSLMLVRMCKLCYKYNISVTKAYTVYKNILQQCTHYITISFQELFTHEQFLLIKLI